MPFSAEYFVIHHFRKYNIFIILLRISQQCIYFFKLWVWEFCLDKTEDGGGSPGSDVTDTCEPPCGCWELNPNSLEEEHVLFTADPYLELHNVCLNSYLCVWVFCLYVCLYMVCIPSVHRDWKRASSDLRPGLRDGCEPPCRC